MELVHTFQMNGWDSCDCDTYRNRKLLCCKIAIQRVEQLNPGIDTHTVKAREVVCEMERYIYM